MMAAIILSCGFVAHYDPSSQDHKVQRVATGSLHIWQDLPTAQAASHPVKVAKAFAAREDAR
jgi:hypothetical protein